MQPNLAIDIALIPPDEVLDRSITINKQLLQQHPSVLALGRTSCLPHITLLQGVIRQQDLAEVTRRVQQIIDGFTSFSLAAELVSQDNFTYYRIESSKVLQQLHELIMGELHEYEVDEVKVGDFDSDTVRQISVGYVRDFRANSAYKNFDPHITLGEGEVKITESIVFSLQRLAICQQGNYNTCKKVLSELRL